MASVRQLVIRAHPTFFIWICILKFLEVAAGYVADTSSILGPIDFSAAVSQPPACQDVLKTGIMKSWLR